MRVAVLNRAFRDEENTPTEEDKRRNLSHSLSSHKGENGGPWTLRGGPNELQPESSTSRSVPARRGGKCFLPRGWALGAWSEGNWTCLGVFRNMKALGVAEAQERDRLLCLGTCTWGRHRMPYIPCLGVRRPGKPQSYPGSDPVHFVEDASGSSMKVDWRLPSQNPYRDHSTDHSQTRPNIPAFVFPFPLVLHAGMVLSVCKYRRTWTSVLTWRIERSSEGGRQIIRRTPHMVRGARTNVWDSLHDTMKQ